MKKTTCIFCGGTIKLTKVQQTKKSVGGVCASCLKKMLG